MEGKTLADRIEEYLKWLLSSNPEGVIEVQRQELARVFACVPSQITYVLGTRFTVERGYLVESRRGGGGYVRIIRLPLRDRQRFQEWVESVIGEYVSQEAGEAILARLCQEGLLSEREKILLKSVIHRQALPLELPERDRVRAAILRSVLLTLLREDL
ncbi:transcriptional regulator [Thermanaeromonas toyohensis ToBE]|uniref:Transcriptional regulator CtsR n=1 Tax=Thermanaeromonas toyohensis ToBE TaxID=698762 RepID=A0A1W1VCF4_9FIRM|nr:CtsR family transcriptional regulator [Thermanaeromonas toyohensis]SMB91089.1 transcriptional regulator [Thermanaeromonas toyohensis ToBE]